MLKRCTEHFSLQVGVPNFCVSVKNDVSEAALALIIIKFINESLFQSIFLKNFSFSRQMFQGTHYFKIALTTVQKTNLKELAAQKLYLNLDRVF